jgi:hypothetical protein
MKVRWLDTVIVPEKKFNIIVSEKSFLKKSGRGAKPMKDRWLNTVIVPDKKI